MTSTPLISVLVPVFNTVEYLPRCLDSVLSQDFRDFELLCIDDGSSDGSLEVLRSYERLDSRVRVIGFSENRGLCPVRNALLDEARGEWVYFIDSDDWIDPGYLAAMYGKAKQTGQDVVVNGSFVKEWDNPPYTDGGGTWYASLREGYYPPSRIQSMVMTSLWVRMYRREYLERNAIRFPLFLNGNEDIYFTGLAELLQTRSYLFFGPRYHYRQRSGSMIHQSKFAFHCLENSKALWDELGRRGISREGMKLFWASSNLVISSEEEFSFIRSFFDEIGDEVRKDTQNYTSMALFLLDAVQGCEDYSQYICRYGPHLGASIIRSRLKG